MAGRVKPDAEGDRDPRVESRVVVASTKTLTQALPVKELVLFDAANMDVSLFRAFTEFTISAEVMDEINEISADGMGKNTSHTYRAKLMNLFYEKGMSSDEMFLVVAMFSEMADPNRVLNHLSTTAWSRKATSKKVMAFIRNCICKYVSNSGRKMPGVKIAESFPSIAMLAQIMIHPDKPIGFFIEQTFACQFNLNAALMMKQKEWEFRRWTRTIRKTNRSNAADDAIKIELGFHEEYWLTKATDTYPLLNADMSVAHMPSEVLTELSFAAYIERQRASLVSINSSIASAAGITMAAEQETAGAQEQKT